MKSSKKSVDSERYSLHVHPPEHCFSGVSFQGTSEKKKKKKSLLFTSHNSTNISVLSVIPHTLPLSFSNKPLLLLLLLLHHLHHTHAHEHTLPTPATERTQLSEKRSCFASFISVLLISRASDGSLTGLMIGDDKLRTLSRSPIRSVA